MPKFEARIIEISIKPVIIEAKNENEAFEKIRHNWESGDIELYADDFYDVEFEIRPLEKINGELNINYDKLVPRYYIKGLALPPAII